MNLIEGNIMYHLAWYTFHTELQWSSFGRSTLRNSIRLRFSCFLFLSVARRCITALVIVGPVIWYIDLIFSGPMKYNVKWERKYENILIITTQDSIVYSINELLEFFIYIKWFSISDSLSLFKIIHSVDTKPWAYILIFTLI